MDGINNRVLKILEIAKQTHMGIALVKLVLYDWPVVLLLIDLALSFLEVELEMECC